MKTPASSFLLFISLLLQFGCGYHMRGSLDMPESLKNIYVFGASGNFETEIVTMLKASKSKLATNAKDASIVVKILKEDMRLRVLSIGTTGKSTESELNYYLRFQFYDNQDHELMDEQTIEISREFFNDQTAVLAKSTEEQLIRTEIYKQAARMMMARAKIAADTNPKKL
jgi:LPS-assembly lipoprotein